MQLFVEKAREFKKDCKLIDLKAAFDSTDCRCLWLLLQVFGFNIPKEANSAFPKALQ